MLNFHQLRWGAGIGLASMLFVLGCTGSTGAQGPKGDPGAQGDPGKQGDPGTVPPLVNDVSGTITDGQSPLSDVAVTASPGDETTTTDGTGAFKLPGLAIGAYELTFHLAGYVDQTIPVEVSLAGPTKLTVVLAVDASTIAAPTVALTDQLAAGFGAPVTIHATAQGKGTLTYAWTQTGGASVTLTGADTDTLQFTTIDFPTAMGPLPVHNARFGALGVNTDQAGDYDFQVTVSDAYGHATSATAHVDATRPTTGLRMVPVGVPVWLQGDGALVSATQTTWSWTLDTSLVQGTSNAAIQGPTSQFPSFVPDLPGTYTVTETVANKSMKIYAGTWMGEMTQDAQDTCTLCHNDTIAPDKFTPWMGTAHHASVQKPLDGAFGQGFAESCLSCHALGYDKSASNGGFDDVMASSGWSFPSKMQPGNWASLESVPKLGQLAGVQCESCHGPQGAAAGGPHANAQNMDLGARIDWSADVCSSCHQENPFNYAPSQWALGPHADLDLALSEGSVEKSPNAAHCGRCHTAQGYARWLLQLKQGSYSYLTNDGNPIDTVSTPPKNHVATAADMTGFGMTLAQVQSQTCVACHDPHDASNPAQLRIYDGVAALPNGLTNISGMGAGMVCATCHNTRNGEHTDVATMAANASGVMAPAALTSFSGPHAPAQTDTLFGFNAYFTPRLNPSVHMAVADTCAGCHFKVTTASQAAAKQTSNHSFLVDDTICASCHASNVDGAGLQAGYRMELDQIRSLWASKLLAPIAAAINAAPGATVLARAYDPSTGLYSSKSSSTSNVVIGAVPTAITYTGLGTSAYGPSATAGVTLTLAAPVTVQWVDANGNNVGSPVSTTTLTVSPSSLKVSSGATTVFQAPTANAASVQVLYKAYWNMSLLNNDNTFGVHNPAFAEAVYQATSAQLKVLP
jgi:hypothetical protein